jgi:acetyl-CoA C-acetyltransferase
MSGRRPVIVGAAQVIQRPDDGDLLSRAGPIELMAQAAGDAAADAGAPALLGRVTWIGVAGGLWRHRDPGALVADLIGVTEARTALAPISGSAPQELVGLAAERIAAGQLDVAIVVGGEARWTARRMQRAGERPRWIDTIGESPDESLPGLPDEMLAELDALGATAPGYALLGDSRRHARRQSMTAHRDEIAALWAGYSTVAARNPYAWDRTVHTPETIREPSASNRMIAYPYTVAMVANNTVDMASAVIVCEEGVARSLGVSPDRFVFPTVSTTAHETSRLVDRHVLHELPALRAAGAMALTMAGRHIDEIEHLDLYACFPSMVQLTCDELGIGTDRPLTVTGGLGFAGAPIGNAAGQSIAAVVAHVRQGGAALVHANGGLATKHAVGVYETSPSRQFARRHVQVPTEPPSAPLEHVEAATVAYDRDGRGEAVLAVLGPAGRRLVRSPDADVVDAVLSGELTE